MLGYAGISSESPVSKTYDANESRANKSKWRMAYTVNDLPPRLHFNG